MSLEIGRYIAYALDKDHAPDLHRLVGGRISPVLVPEAEDIVLPWVWYYSTSMSEEESKDGVVAEVCSVQIEVVAIKYEQLLEILLLLRKAMADALRFWQIDREGESFVVTDQSYQAGPEEYDEVLQGYCRTLTYTIETYTHE